MDKGLVILTSYKNEISQVNIETRYCSYKVLKRSNSAIVAGSETYSQDKVENYKQARGAILLGVHTAHSPLLTQTVKKNGSLSFRTRK